MKLSKELVKEILLDLSARSWADEYGDQVLDIESIKEVLELYKDI